jgi:four helix bundle protein
MQNAKCKKIQERAFEFACRIVKLHLATSRTPTTRRICDQLLDSGTSIGANLEEAEAGHSRADFIAKCRIALKEARETVYWLRLLSTTALIRSERLDPLTNEAREIVAILTTIVRKASARA